MLCGHEGLCNDSCSSILNPLKFTQSRIGDTNKERVTIVQFWGYQRIHQRLCSICCLECTYATNISQLEVCRSADSDYMFSMSMCGVKKATLFRAYSRFSNRIADSPTVMRREILLNGKKTEKNIRLMKMSHIKTTVWWTYFAANIVCSCNIDTSKQVWVHNKSVKWTKEFIWDILISLILFIEFTRQLNITSKRSTLR